MAYAGDVTSRQAWDSLSENKRAVLVDVRTRPEWSYVGLPQLDAIGKRVLLVSWQRFPALDLNPQFAEELAAHQIGKDDPIYFICRSGVRSRAAAEAATANGYKRCFNVADGFEGPRDGEGHRGRLAGWKASGLPWVQD
jgi:rhodanese-related sulfurtransferase